MILPVSRETYEAEWARQSALNAPIREPYERAAQVLSRHKHRGYSEWELFPTAAGLPDFVHPVDGPSHEGLELDPFEALAVAEKYERDGP